jgi:hypothetical protein
MNLRTRFPIAATLAFAVVALLPSAAARAQTGTVEFTVVVTPASGHPEPAMRQMIYLLRHSFEETRKQAEAEEPKPDLDKFVDGLQLSPELKAWMKKARTTTIIGEPFHSMLKPDDVIHVPEFLNAYVEANLNEVEADMGFPKPKYRAKDKVAKPAKYEQARKQYLDALRSYYEKNPHSADTIVMYLAEWDHTAEWNRLMASWRKRVHDRAIQEAQSRELVAKIETDLQGRGSFQAAPGTYWITTLEGQALAGDVRLRWNIPLIVEAGQVTRVELSNTNGERTPI